MTKIPENDGWLESYAESHQNLTYPWLYGLAIFMVVIGVTGLLWSVPVPLQFFEISPLLNWGSAFLMAAGVYYFIISLSIAIGMLPFLMGVAAVQLWLAQSDYSAIRVSAGLLIAGSIALWLGHRNKPGVKPLLEDLMLAMIGPAWMLSVLYRRMGIPF